MSFWNRRNRLVVGTLLGLYFMYALTHSYSKPRASHRTSIDSARLQLARELEDNMNWKEYGINFQPNKKASLPIESTVRQQLAYQFPYELDKPFQKNIWQTWKVDLEDSEFPANFRKFQNSWEEVNKGYKHFVIKDEECIELINQLYQGVPDVVEAYNIMPKSILKADFFRYLILFARGGVYSDIDTVSIKPIDTWLSNNATLYGKPNNPGLVVGIEADPDRPDWAEWYARRIQFCQWTIQAKRGHPMLRELITKITEITLERKKKGALKKTLGKDAGGDIMNWTGPGIWTDMVFEYMNNIFQSPENLKKNVIEQVVSWKLFTGMEMPIAIDDVMVLPITSFSPDVGQMGAGDTTHPMAYAKHMFEGSWKDTKPI
ncbi:glycosyltransferase family 32 protein [Suhomyces tanzawaensis NRRL Y-17324]|uniref:Glycosyltransferase family 32 protein n=1 Tax=Suhomyces tanzawaensis NRRL Y-17324 TaxID=984487 RepID=A0A1E4SID3_9ASCO|nr:glycosyltransferase family 32 protein [Suhomyces tanzawaensis NRRL Y-17324]ODV79274.1 glycosyltransferase family 32 protein [Suhomyces tanzawaensis NRRL Y-17324]